MDTDKYNRNIALLCPTCGNSEFSHDEDTCETSQLITCTSCGRSLTKDELIIENSENIDVNLSEVKDEITKDLEKELKESLKRAFKGNKNIRIK
ncbi:ECs_2282 family putative zinc-binding protein [Stutzerimonas stutzeri]|uniref:ECs_2282 family putative zinc-binding protein n=1 Tax=Stutzerimonas stutzeri TaxID=316 RepID=UPI001F37261A|nr:hypothetical protein [Stutzerimonas stutzeri]